METSVVQAVMLADSGTAQARKATGLHQFYLRDDTFFFAKDPFFFPAQVALKDYSRITQPAFLECKLYSSFRGDGRRRLEGSLKAAPRFGKVSSIGFGS
jgi:hypothetical protein